jgi:hypothetical protein
MAKTVTGFFRTQTEGQAAQQALLNDGFDREEVSFVAGDTSGHQTPKVGPAVPDTGSESEAASDAWIGGVVGLAAGLIAVVLPGIGPLIAAGPIAGAIGGLTVGAAAGGLIGLLMDHGITEEQAEFYAEGVRRGGSLVTVHGIPEDREKDARRILDENGAIEVEQLADEWRRTGWKGPGATIPTR